MRFSHKRKRIEIDAIFTWSGGGNALCCVAAQMGFGYGFNSGSFKACPYHATMEGHEVLFIDNDYKQYDHAKHLDVVAQFNPKYATVLDIERVQDIDKILRFAEDIAKFTENVIVIPKVDCIAEIPEQHMLGYAVPTSYGGTDLHPSAFGNRHVHLLGGSWSQQRDLLLGSGMNIVSLDFNHAHKLAKEYGMYNDALGFEYKLSDTLPGFNRKPYFTAMTLSFAGIRTGLDNVQNTLTLHAQRYSKESHALSDAKLEDL